MWTNVPNIFASASISWQSWNPPPNPSTVHLPVAVYIMFVYCKKIMKKKTFLLYIFVKKYWLLTHCIITLLLYGFTKYNFQQFTPLFSCEPCSVYFTMPYPISCQLIQGQEKIFSLFSIGTRDTIYGYVMDTILTMFVLGVPV